MNSLLQRRRTIRGIICAAIGGTCWGFSGTLAQLLMNEYGMPITWLVPVRMWGASLLFLLVILCSQRSAFVACLRDKKSLLQIAALALFGVFMTQVCYLSCIHHTNSGTGTVLERTGLVCIMLVTCIRAARWPRMKELIGLVLALAGTAIIAFQGDFTQLSISGVGLAFGLLSGVSLMFYTMIPVRVLHKWGSLIVTCLALFIAGAVGMLVMQPWTVSVDLHPGACLGVAALIVIGTFGAYLFYLQGVNDAGPVKASLVGCVEPISATLFASLWLHTAFTIWDIIGCALIITMMFLVVQKEEESKVNEGALPDTSRGVSSYDLVETSSAEVARWESSADTNEALTPLFKGSASELGVLHTRPATIDDREEIQQILSDAREFLLSMQVRIGVKAYPSARRLEKSIRAQDCHVVCDNEGSIVAVFNVSLGGDSWYDQIYEGRWLSSSASDKPDYAVVRWLTVRRDVCRGGVGSYALSEAERIARESGKTSMRADIYEGNIPMQRVLLKQGYSFCGRIVAQTYFEGPRKRLAFEKLL